MNIIYKRNYLYVVFKFGIISAYELDKQTMLTTMRDPPG